MAKREPSNGHGGSRGGKKADGRRSTRGSPSPDGWPASPPTKADEWAALLARELPKRTYVLLSGRQHKVIDDQASIYGLPVAKSGWKLDELLRWLHDCIADGRLRPLNESADDERLARRERELKVRLAEAKLAREEGRSWPADRVKELLDEETQIECDFRQRIEKAFGSQAADLWDEMLHQKRERAERLFAAWEGRTDDE